MRINGLRTKHVRSLEEFLKHVEELDYPFIFYDPTELLIFIVTDEDIIMFRLRSEDELLSLARSYVLIPAPL